MTEMKVGGFHIDVVLPEGQPVVVPRGTIIEPIEPLIDHAVNVAIMNMDVNDVFGREVGVTTRRQ